MESSQKEPRPHCGNRSRSVRCYCGILLAHRFLQDWQAGTGGSHPKTGRAIRLRFDMFTTSEPGGTPHDLDSVISESVVGLPRIREHQRSIEPPQASKTVSPAIAELDDTDRQTFQHDRRPHHPQPTPGHPPKSWVVAGISRTPTQTKDFLHQERRVGPRRCDHVQLRSLLRHCPSRRKCLPLDHRPGLPE